MFKNSKNLRYSFRKIWDYTLRKFLINQHSATSFFRFILIFSSRLKTAFSSCYSIFSLFLPFLLIQFGSLSRASFSTCPLWSFQFRISSVNVTKSAVSCSYGHIYWKNPKWKTSSRISHLILIHHTYFFLANSFFVQLAYLACQQ